MKLKYFYKNNLKINWFVYYLCCSKILLSYGPIPAHGSGQRGPGEKASSYKLQLKELYALFSFINTCHLSALRARPHCAWMEFPTTLVPHLGPDLGGLLMRLTLPIELLIKDLSTFSR